MLKFGCAAFAIYILHAEQHPATHILCHPLIQKSGIGMAEMKGAIGAGCESENRNCHARWTFLALFTLIDTVFAGSCKDEDICAELIHSTILPKALRTCC